MHDNVTKLVPANLESRNYLYDYFSTPMPWFKSRYYASKGWESKSDRYMVKERVSTGLFLAHVATLKQIGHVEVEDQRTACDMEKVSTLLNWEPYPGFKLRADQIRGLQAVRKARKQGGIILAATGVGKTVMAAGVFKLMRGRGIFVVDTLDLLEQSADELGKLLQEEIGKIGDGTFRPRRITVATIQTLDKLVRQLGKNEKASRLWEKWWPTLQVTMIDELHSHCNKRVEGVLAELSKRKVYGMTATLELDKPHVAMRAHSLAGPVIYDYRYSQALQDDNVANGVVVSVSIARNLDARLTAGEQYLKYIVRSKTRNMLLENLVRECVHKKRSVLLLLERQKHIRIMAQRLADINPAVVYGPIAVGKRKQSMKEFEEGTRRVIIASKVFTKGVNLKRCNAIIDGAALSSRTGSQQKFGRGVRLFEGKEGLLYLDVGDVLVNRQEKNRFFFRTRERINALKTLGVTVLDCAPDNAISEGLAHLRKVRNQKRPITN